MVDERFLAEIDAAYPKLGFGDRATFVRDAVIKELARAGYPVSAQFRAGPPRKGKGGRPKKAENSSLLKVAEDDGPYNVRKPNKGVEPK